MYHTCGATYALGTTLQTAIPTAVLIAQRNTPLDSYDGWATDVRDLLPGFNITHIGRPPKVDHPGLDFTAGRVTLVGASLPSTAPSARPYAPPSPGSSHHYGSRGLCGSTAALPIMQLSLHGMPGSPRPGIRRQDHPATGCVP